MPRRLPLIVSRLCLVAFMLAACGTSTPEADGSKGAPRSPAETSAEGETSRVPSVASKTEDTSSDPASSGTDVVDERFEPLEPPDPPPPFEVPDEDLPEAGDVALVRAKEALAGKIKATNKMMAQDQWGHDLFALHGVPRVPEWSSRSEDDPGAAYDVDLATTWTCTPKDDGSCAWGLAFPEPASLRMIRLLPRSSRIGEGGEGATIERVRVHTDAGHLDAVLGEASGFHYLVLPEPLTTSSLTVEFTRMNGDEVRLAELEAFGTSGVARPPLPVDPTRTWVEFDKRPWGSVSGVHGIRETVLVFDGDRARQLVKATALYGRPGDRYMLVERMWKSDCSDQDVAYTLVDTMTRRWIHVGKLAGVPATVHRHQQGLGFAIRGDLETWLVLEDGNRIARKRASRQLPPEYEDRPMMRGGGSVSDPPAGCTVATAEQLAALPEDDRPKPGDTGMAISCDAGVFHAVVQAGRSCGGRWTVHVLDGENRVIEKLTALKSGARSPRIQRGSHGELYLELSPVRDGQSSVVTVSDKGLLRMLTATGALAIRRPVPCQGCDDAWVGPRVGL